MKEYTRNLIRNIAIVGHGKSGKTSLTDTLIFNAGYAKRIGKVDEGTSLIDFEVEEVKRKMSISSTLASCEWQGYKLNFIDTPGYPDFIGEVKSVMQAADSALIVLCAPAGIEVETEKVWEYASAIKLPRAFFINKMDREHADFYAVVEQLKVKFGTGVVPIQIPIGSEEAFHGVVDLLSMNTRFVTSNNVPVEGEIPEFLQKEVENARQQLIEVVAEFNNDLLDKYLEGKDISEEEVSIALAEGIQAAKIFPVLCGSSLKNIGSRKLLNSIINYMPEPMLKPVMGIIPDTGEIIERVATDEFSAIVFKTTADPFVGRLNYLKIISGVLKADMTLYNVDKEKSEKINAFFTMRGKQQEAMEIAHAGDIVVIAKMQYVATGDTLCSKENTILYEPIEFPKPMFTMGIQAKNKGDEDKISNALGRITDEDLTIKVFKDSETKQLLISGIGELHLEIILDKIKRKFGVEVLLKERKIPYRETITASEKVEGKHKKQSGGHGQYGHVWLQIEPLPAGSGFEFIETLFGGAIPKQYVPAVEKGVRETLEAGILAGYPMVDIKVNLCDGSYHNVDSSEIAFKMASALAIKKGAMLAKPILLEPIYNLTISIPEYYMGDIIGNLNASRGRILGMENITKGMGLVRAQAPLSELARYATDLRSISQGRGTFDMEFSHYEELPNKLAKDIIESKKNEKSDI